MKNSFKKKFLVLVLMLSVTFCFVPAPRAHAAGWLGGLADLFTGGLFSALSLTVITLAPGIALCVIGGIGPGFCRGDGDGMTIITPSTGVSGCQLAIPLTFYIPVFNSGTGDTLCYNDSHQECPLANLNIENGSCYSYEWVGGEHCGVPVPPGYTSYAKSIPISIDETRNEIVIYRDFISNTISPQDLAVWYLKNMNDYTGSGWVSHSWDTYFYNNAARSPHATFDYSQICKGNVCKFKDADNVPQNSYVMYAAKILGNYTFGMSPSYVAWSEGSPLPGASTLPNKFLSTVDTSADISNWYLATLPTYNPSNGDYNLGNTNLGPFKTEVPVCPGACGSANGKTYAYSDTSYGSDTQCSSGTSTYSTFPSAGSSVVWICLGENGGTSSGICSASRSAAPTCTSSPNACGATNTGTTVNGVCNAGIPANPSGYGSSCASAANTCGQTNSGTIQCSGSCSVSTPANPSGYGTSCTSAANACGQKNTGTIQCSGSCSASTPANPSGYGTSCTSAANACGQTNSGTIQCSGSCSVSTPANPSGYGNGCTSSANSCGQKNTGTVRCNGCSASAPSNSGCSCAAPLIQTVTVACDPNAQGLAATSGSVTRSQIKGAYPACAFPAAPVTTSNSTYVSDNCAYPAPVNGACGSANGVAYAYGSSSYSPKSQCSSGSPSSTSFPSAGNSISWTCSSTNGGSVSGTCSASQNIATPTASLFASPTNIDVGHSATLTWSSTYATSCTGTGFTAGGVSGSRSTGTLDTPGVQNYQVVCAGPGGNSSPAFASVTVLAPNASISAAPTRVQIGANSTITWSASQVISCAVSGPGLSAAGLSGSRAVAVNSQSTYTITCQTNSSPITQSVTVNVVPAFQEF